MDYIIAMWQPIIEMARPNSRVFSVWASMTFIRLTNNTRSMVNSLKRKYPEFRANSQSQPGNQSDFQIVSSMNWEHWMLLIVNSPCCMIDRLIGTVKVLECCSKARLLTGLSPWLLLVSDSLSTPILNLSFELILYRYSLLILGSSSNDAHF